MLGHFIHSSFKFSLTWTQRVSKVMRTKKDRGPLEGNDGVRVGCGDRVGGEGRPLKLTLKPRLWGERPVQIWGECRGAEGTAGTRSQKHRALDSSQEPTGRRPVRTAG